jgi:hypothetical protein
MQYQLTVLPRMLISTMEGMQDENRVPDNKPRARFRLACIVADRPLHAG